MNPYSRARRGGGDRLLVPAGARGVRGQRHDGAPDVARRLGEREVGRSPRAAGAGLDRVEPVLLGDAEVVEHHLRAKPAGRDGDGGGAVLRQLMSLREGQAVDRDLGQIVEDGDPVARGIVVGRAVRHLDQQAARLPDEQRQEVVGRDQVRLDGEAEDAKAPVEIVLPDRRVPLRGSTLEQLAAPDVVHEHVDPAVLLPDPVGEGAHLSGIEMVHGHRDADAPEPRDEVGRLLDGLRAVVLGPVCPRAAPRADDGSAGLAQRGGDAPPGAARRARNDGQAAAQRLSIGRPCHGSSVP